MKDFETLEEWVKEINLAEIPIIVEGKNDIKALRSIGIDNEVFSLSKKPIYKVVEDFEAKETIILTDFDKKGKELYGRLKSSLQSMGVKVDNFFREWLQKNMKISHIEGIEGAKNNKNCYIKNNNKMRLKNKIEDSNRDEILEEE